MLFRSSIHFYMRSIRNQSIQTLFYRCHIFFITVHPQIAIDCSPRIHGTIYTFRNDKISVRTYKRSCNLSLIGIGSTSILKVKCNGYLSCAVTICRILSSHNEAWLLSVYGGCGTHRIHGTVYTFWNDKISVRTYKRSCNLSLIGIGSTSILKVKCNGFTRSISILFHESERNSLWLSVGGL